MGLREGVKCQTGHNVHERSSESQQGGTRMIKNEEVSQHVTTQGSYDEGLGRWILMRLAGDKAATRIITNNIPWTTRKKDVTATIAQKIRC